MHLKPCIFKSPVQPQTPQTLHVQCLGCLCLVSNISIPCIRAAVEICCKLLHPCNSQVQCHCRSVSWTERMRALRSSPSLAAPKCPTPDVDPTRRHTTGEAAHPSDHGSWQETNLQHYPAADQSATERNVAPSSLTSTPELSNVPSDAQPQSSAPAEGPSRENQPLVAHFGKDGEPNAEADLLSFAAEEASWHHSREGIVGQPVQMIDLTNSDSSGDKDYTEASSSIAQANAPTQLQDNIRSSGIGSLSFDHSFVSPCLLLPGEFLADDPFQQSAGLSAEVSQSSRRLSGLSMLADSQGSDLDSWGSFRLPDESSNLMTGDMVEREAGSAQLSHPAVAGTQNRGDFSEVSPSSVPVADSHSVNSADCEVSPNACITSKQRLQLDLFLQSSGPTSTGG